MKVVSNSSPLVNLSRIGRLSILRSLYGEILIPEAVYKKEYFVCPSGFILFPCLSDGA